MVNEIFNSSINRIVHNSDIRAGKPDIDLHVGQLLKATVIRAIGQDELLMNINGQNINAKTAHQHLPGSILHVKVAAMDSNTIVLQVLGDAKTPSLIQQQLLQLLPKQGTAPFIFSNMQAMLASDATPHTIKLQIYQILAQLPQLSQLSQHFAQSVLHSGVFFESALARWHKNILDDRIRSDFKGQLLKLKGMLHSTEQTTTLLNQDAPPDINHLPMPLTPIHQQGNHDNLQERLSADIEALIARISLCQLQMLKEGQGQRFLVELPFHGEQGVDMLALTISHHEATPEQPGHWSIAFAKQFESLGAIQAEVSLISNILDVYIHAEDKNTVELLKTKRTEFNELLQGSGLMLRKWLLEEGLQSPDVNHHLGELLDIRI